MTAALEKLANDIDALPSKNIVIDYFYVTEGGAGFGEHSEEGLCDIATLKALVADWREMDEKRTKEMVYNKRMVDATLSIPRFNID